MGTLKSDFKPKKRFFEMELSSFFAKNNWFGRKRLIRPKIGDSVVILVLILKGVKLTKRISAENDRNFRPKIHRNDFRSYTTRKWMTHKLLIILHRKLPLTYSNPVDISHLSQTIRVNQRREM